VLLERAGKIGGEESRGGSITGFYTILVEGDDMTEPVADAVRGILDGHLMLSRKLAQRGVLPAIDVLDSISRVAGEISSDEHLAARQDVLSLLSAYRDVEELIQIGAYTRGSSPLTDTAVDLMPRIESFLGQRSGVDSTASEAVEELKAIALSARTALAARSTGSSGAGSSGGGRR
jgi:flagellum-specific ATP synthase